MGLIKCYLSIGNRVFTAKFQCIKMNVLVDIYKVKPL